MMIFFYLFFLIVPTILLSQNKDIKVSAPNLRNQSQRDIVKNKVAPIDLYRVITIDKDTTYINTSLTIQKEYSHDYLRKDIFGLLPFSNDGQTYNTLQYSLTVLSPYPEFGFKAKHFNFLEANQIRCNSVATPVTELYFKTTIKKGQSADAFISLNTYENLNFSIAYKGLRSEGEYLNQLSSTGNLGLCCTHFSDRNLNDLR